MAMFEVEQLALPGQQRYGDSRFPWVLGARGGEATTEAAAAWVEQHRQQLKSLATEHGAVFLRDFGLKDAHDFDRLIAALDVENFPYKRSLSNAVRINYTERVFSANEAPPTVKIYLHHEMAQTPLFPTFILFFCELAAESGGATPICRSDILYDRVAECCPQLLRDLEAKGLKYSNVMPAVDDANSGMGRSWQSTLGVQTKAEAERRLAELGYSFTWLDGDSLRATTPVLPGVRLVSPGRKTLFNQLIAAYSGWSDDRNDPSKAIRHGDDSRLDAEAVAQLIAIADELSFDVPWQAGDAVLLDNTIAMHGRRPFVGKRRVLASLGDMQTHAFHGAPLTESPN